MKGHAKTSAEKWAIVKALLAGESATSLARTHGISRQAPYKWERLLEARAELIFEHGQRLRAAKKREDLVEFLQAENQMLRDRIESLHNQLALFDAPRSEEGE